MFNPPKGKPVSILDEGITVVDAASSIDFVGTTIAATGVGDDATITASGTGTGDVVGPASATDNAVARFDTTTGKLIQNSSIIIDDNANTSGFESIKLNTAPASVPAYAEGQMYWDADERAVSVETGLTSSTIQLGQELGMVCKNQTGSAISDGTPVMFAGTLGASGRIKMQKAIADGTYPTTYTIGILTESTSDGGDGFVTWFGKVRNIDTTGTPYGEVWNDGDLLYISESTAGYLTKTKPNAPNETILIAAVVYAHATNGVLMVRPTWTNSIVDANDVNGTALTTDGQIMVWDNTNSYFDFTYNITDYLTTATAASTYAPIASPTFTTSITGSYLTASEMLITDASKNVVSAPVATYPSLTELTYVKGVTSSIQSQFDAMANGMIYKGNWDASVGTFPGAGVAQTGWFYTVSVGGTVDSVVFNVGDRLIATTDNASTTVYASNWTKLDATDAVTSVAGRTGNVTLTESDITDLGTTVAMVADNLSVFASTTSAQLAGVISDETGSGSLVFGTSPTLTTPVISSIVNTGTLTLPTSTDTLVGRATTDTLTNKRITKRVTSETSSATPTINTDNADIHRLTAQAVDVTSFTTNLSGTPTHGQSLIIEITGTAARAITWGASFEASTVTLPTTTVGTDMLTVGFLYNSATSKWRCVAAV